MASITPADFRARFPEFNDLIAYPDAFIQIFIDDTECEMDEAAWGCFFEKGQAYLVAHYIAISELTSGGGTGSGSGFGSLTHSRVMSETEGDTSVTYGAGTSTNGAFAGAGKDELIASTLYGQQYIELRSKTVPGITSSGSDVGAVARGA